VIALFGNMLAPVLCLLVASTGSLAQEVSCNGEGCEAKTQALFQTKSIKKHAVQGSWPHLVPVATYMPKRNQWDANSGYCGETSFIQAGLYYGQYFSQYFVRKLVSGHQSDEKDQLLLGVNDMKAAKLLKMTYQKFTPDTDVEVWAEWIKSHLLQGHPVVTAVLANFDPDFFGTAEADLAPGQDEYDHIVSIVNVTGDSFDNYQFTFYDHGEWQLLRPKDAHGPDANTNGVFTYKLKDVYKSRDACNTANTAYCLIDSSQNKYAIALTGNADVDTTDGHPVTITTSPVEEVPVMEEESEKKPAPSPMKLSVTCYGLQPSSSYVLHMYKSLADVPGKSDDPSANAAKSWPFTTKAAETSHAVTTFNSFASMKTGSGTMSSTTTVSIRTDDVAIFRCYDAE